MKILYLILLTLKGYNLYLFNLSDNFSALEQFKNKLSKTKNTYIFSSPLPYPLPFTLPLTLYGMGYGTGWEPDVGQNNIASNQNIDTNVDLSNIQENNILGPLYDFIDSYQKMLSTLSTEQLGCLSNGIGFILVFSAFTSIVTILFGEYIINKLQLETKYPKLARFIQIRQKINKYFIIYNIIFIYFVLIAFICLNIFMFIQVK